MGKLTIVLGGARSGKSAFAMELAGSIGKIAYIATADLSDDPEMRHRIKEHRKSRPSHWITVEEPLDVEKILVDPGEKTETIIIDCVTLLLSNWLLKGVMNVEALGVKDYLDKER